MIDLAKAVAIMDYSCVGDRLLVVTNGGGMAVAAADQATLERLVMPSLPDAVREKLGRVFPSFFVLNNPIDLTGSGKNEHYFHRAHRSVAVL